MPGNDTHARAGSAGGAVACVLLGLPVGWWVVPIVAATVASPWPDRLEKIPRRLWRFTRKRKRLADGRVDRLLRHLQVHRRWTHWALSTGLLVALLAGVIVAGMLVGAAVLVLIVLEGIVPDKSATMPAEVWTFVPWVSAFAALGVFVGYALHSYLDAWTSLGSPFFGIPGLPRTQRRVHFAKKKRWIDEDDEEALRALAPIVIVACVCVHYREPLWPVVLSIYDVARTAL